MRFASFQSYFEHKNIVIMAQISQGTMDARDLLLALLSFLSLGPSFWFLINGDAKAEYSLCRRLGFYSEIDYRAFLVGAGLAGHEVQKDGSKNFVFWPKEWKALLNNDEFDLSVANAEYSKKIFDLDSLLLGHNQVDKKRNHYHAIRLGQRNSETYFPAITKQKHAGTKRFITTPPPVPTLRAHQRKFQRKAQKVIASTIVDNEDVFFDSIQLSRADIKKNQESEAPDTKADDAEDACDPEPTTTSIFAGQATPSKEAPSPTSNKAPCLPIQVTPSQQPPAIVPPTPAVLVEPDLVGKAIDFSHADASKNLDKLIAQAIGLKQNLSKDPLSFEYYDYKKRQKTSYVRVHRNRTDSSFFRRTDWLQRILEINGMGEPFKSAKRTAKFLKRKFEQAFNEFIKEEDMAPDPMDAVEIASMFKAGGVTSRPCRRGLMCVLRNHFGKNAFAPEYKVQLLCEGHSPVMTGSFEHAYEDGAVKETITYSQKNVAAEAVAQLTRQLRSRNFVPSDVERVDIITGGDHGLGAFVAGSRIVVIADERRQDDDGRPIESFSFEISVAEILCRKDNAKILSESIKDELTKGLEQLATSEINFYLSSEGEIDCALVDESREMSVKPNLYVVGDLAFYGMVLGKESMSGHWCHLCQLSAKEFADLKKIGKAWTYKEMEELGAKFVGDKDAKKKPTLGVKDVPWWNFIPLEHFICPLLHCLIGIGDDLFSKFREVVSEEIEFIGGDEIEARGAKAAIQVKIDSLVEQRDNWDKSESGKCLKRLKGKATRAQAMLKKLGVVNKAAPTTTRSSRRDDAIAVVRAGRSPVPRVREGVANVPGQPQPQPDAQRRPHDPEGQVPQAHDEGGEAGPCARGGREGEARHHRKHDCKRVGDRIVKGFPLVTEVVLSLDPIPRREREALQRFRRFGRGVSHVRNSAQARRLPLSDPK